MLRTKIDQVLWEKQKDERPEVDQHGDGKIILSLVTCSKQLAITLSEWNGFTSHVLDNFIQNLI